MNFVFRRSAAVLLAVIAIHSVAVAQDAPAADQEKQVLPERATLLPERIAFCKKFYNLNDSEAEKLRLALEAKVLLHRDYMRDHQVDLRRLTATISVALPQQDTAQYSPAEKERFRAYYQDQIYRVYEEAPMSLSYAVQHSETIVGDERANQGRAAIAKFFKPVLGDKSVDTAHMDRLVMKPVRMEDISMTDDLTSAQAKLLGGDVATKPQRDPKKNAPKMQSKTEKTPDTKAKTTPPAPPLGAMARPGTGSAKRARSAGCAT